MSVQYSWTNVRDWKALHEDEFEQDLTRALCYGNWGPGLLAAIGMDSITNENIGEVCFRMRVTQAVYGAGMSKMSNGVWQDYIVTDSDLIRRIGVTTNFYGKDKTRAAFMKGINLEGYALSQKINQRAAAHIPVMVSANLEDIEREATTLRSLG